MFPDLKELNKNIKDLVEALRDLNIMIATIFGGRVAYKDGSEEEKEKEK